MKSLTSLLLTLPGWKMVKQLIQTRSQSGYQVATCSTSNMYIDGNLIVNGGLESDQNRYLKEIHMYDMHG